MQEGTPWWYPAQKIPRECSCEPASLHKQRHAYSIARSSHLATAKGLPTRVSHPTSPDE